jgi:hypothetical protein
MIHEITKKGHEVTTTESSEILDYCDDRSLDNASLCRHMRHVRTASGMLGTYSTTREPRDPLESGSGRTSFRAESEDGGQTAQRRTIMNRRAVLSHADMLSFLD